MIEPEMFKTLLDSTGEAVIVTDTDLDPPGPRILYVNPAFEKLSGWLFGDIVGQTPRVLQGPKTDRATLDLLRAGLLSGRVVHGTMVNYRADRSEYIVEWCISPVKSDSGITHFVAVQRDVTHQHNREQELREKLDAVTIALENRKVVERAKGILMNRLNLSEPEAHRRLQQISIDRQTKMAEVARSIILSEEENLIN